MANANDEQRGRRAGTGDASTAPYVVPATEERPAAQTGAIANAAMGGGASAASAPNINGLASQADSVVQNNRLSHVDTSSQKSMLDQWLDTQTQQNNAQIDRGVTQGVNELSRTWEDAEAQYQTQQNQIDANERRALDNQALYAAARGDRGGIGTAQYNSVQNAAMQNRVTVNTARTKMKTDIFREIAELRANGEFQKADAALSLTQQYLQQLMSLEQWAIQTNLSVDQFNAQLAQWAQDYKAKAAELGVNMYQFNETMKFNREQADKEDYWRGKQFEEGVRQFDVSNQTTRDLAEMSDRTQRYGIDTSAQTSRYSTDMSYKLGAMQIASNEEIAKNANAMQKYVADLNAVLTREGIASNEQLAAASNELQWRLGQLSAQVAREGYASNETIAAAERALRKYLGELDADTTIQGYATNKEIAQINTNAQILLGNLSATVTREGYANSKEIAAMNNQTSKEIAAANNKTSIDIANINSETSKYATDVNAIERQKDREEGARQYDTTTAQNESHFKQNLGFQQDQLKSQNQNRLANEAITLINSGIMPDSERLAAAGITKADAEDRISVVHAQEALGVTGSQLSIAGQQLSNEGIALSNEGKKLSNEAAQTQLDALKNGSSGSSFQDATTQLFEDAKASGNPQSFIANNYKSYGLTSSSGLYNDYKNWASGGGSGGMSYKDARSEADAGVWSDAIYDGLASGGMSFADIVRVYSDADEENGYVHNKRFLDYMKTKVGDGPGNSNYENIQSMINTVLNGKNSPQERKVQEIQKYVNNIWNGLSAEQRLSLISLLSKHNIDINF